MTYGWIWLAIALFGILATLITKKIQYISLTPGAIAAMLLDILDKRPLTQLIVFVSSISIVFFILTVILSVVIRRKKQNGVLNSIVGSKCTVVEVIDEYAGSGQVRVNGQEWAARLVDDDVAQVGQTLKIVAIEGPKLICKK